MNLHSLKFDPLGTIFSSSSSDSSDCEKETKKRKRPVRSCYLDHKHTGAVLYDDTTEPEVRFANVFARCEKGCLRLVLLRRRRCECIFHKINSQVTPATLECLASVLPQSRHLLDDSVIEDGITSDATSTGSSEGVAAGTKNQPVAVGSQLHNSIVGFQGCVRRKTLLKDGRKPAVASWQRYWLQIWANSLVYFPPKSFKGNERIDFKREPCKVCSLIGWSAQLLDNPQQYNTFQLINTAIGTVYKFRTSSAHTTAEWLEALRQDPLMKSQNSVDKQLPINLMSFE